MRITYANCLLVGADDCDVLLTDEVSVAEAAPEGVRVLLADTLYAPDEAQALNVEIFRAAFDWFRTTGIDPTEVDGISAADLASIEITCTLLMPAARGWLGTAAALAPDGPLRGETPESITICAPAPASPEARRYRAIESLQCDGAEAAVRARFGESVALSRRDGEPVSGLLEQKYAQTRDWTWLVPQTRAEYLMQAVPAGVINAIAAARGRRRASSLLVYEYNPTNAFAEQYGAATEGRLRLARCRTPRRDLPQIIRRADRLVVPPRGVAAPATADDHLSVLARYTREHDDAYRERFRLRGVDFWPLIRERLLKVVGGYQAFVTGAASPWRARLRRDRVRAVMVPFDTPPEARLLMSVAQAERIPTFLVNDGFKADDFAMEGMTADHVLAWSTALAENYYSRRRGQPAVVTGNPKADAQRTAPTRRSDPTSVQRVLVGSFTFSPIDLNCRRSDSESFLGGILAGIRDSRLARGATVRLKLHPADRPDHYRAVFESVPEVPVEIVTRGDVVSDFDSADIYITTYSTSLLEAVARNLPVIYYRVNPQRTHAPFSDDPFLEARTAQDAQQLARLLDDPSLRESLAPKIRDAWVERYLGATDGRSTARIAQAILGTLGDQTSAPS